MPLKHRWEIVEKLNFKFNDTVLLKTPGFYKNKKGFVVLGGAPGILIPILDSERNIIALKIRRDMNSEESKENYMKGKYCWLSSKAKGGQGSGAPIHIPLSENSSFNRVRLTEGELKADIATALSGIPTLSLPGVTIWKPILPVLKHLNVKAVCLSIDSDARSNRKVAEALLKMAKALQENGYAIEIETWEESHAKGIDDALLEKSKNRVLSGCADV